MFEVDPSSQAANLDRARAAEVPRSVRRTRPSHRPGHRTIYLTEDASARTACTSAGPRRPASRAARARCAALRWARVATPPARCRRCAARPRGLHVADLSRPPRPAPVRRRPGSTSPTATPRRLSVRKQFADDAGHPQPQARGPWWGDGGAYFVASFARDQRRQRQRARRPGLVLRPARPRPSRSRPSSASTPTPPSRRRLRRPGQHHASRRTAASSSPRTARACSHLVGVTEHGRGVPAGPQRPQRERVHRPYVLAPTARCCSPTSSRPGIVFAIRGPWKRVSKGLTA